MKKRYILLAVILIIAIYFSDCAKSKYDEDEIIGLTSAEVFKNTVSLIEFKVPPQRTVCIGKLVAVILSEM